MSYKIIRYFKNENTPNKLIKNGLTLEEAQSHCNCADTKKEGVFFDGYTEE